MKREARVEVKQSKGFGETPNLEFAIKIGSRTSLVRQFFDKDGRCTDITRRTGNRDGKKSSAEERFDLTLLEKVI